MEVDAQVAVTAAATADDNIVLLRWGQILANGYLEKEIDRQVAAGKLIRVDTPPSVPPAPQPAVPLARPRLPYHRPCGNPAQARASQATHRQPRSLIKNGITRGPEAHLVWYQVPVQEANATRSCATAESSSRCDTGGRSKKTTVEDSLCLSISSLIEKKALVAGSWTRGSWQLLFRPMERRHAEPQRI